MKSSKIPPATITRLSFYYRKLEHLIKEDVNIVSSEKLAQLCDVNPAQIRKDLAYFGEFGVRGVGYYTAELLGEIKKILGLNRIWRMAVVGIGNLGSALVAHDNFHKHGYHFVAAFDNDPRKVDQVLQHGLRISHIDDMPQVLEEVGRVDIGVIATPAAWAQDVANRLFKTGIRSLLNFAPIQILTPEGCMVQNVDFTVKLD
ncbi:MAG: redox-sensing transcriptional repressor Rex, partial [Deltaproteobacteria bacterium]|nr:redox-sensing transcriptional repressor Rex [Deltaproteobacteria bacterium]